MAYFITYLPVILSSSHPITLPITLRSPKTSPKRDIELPFPFPYTKAAFSLVSSGKDLREGERE